MLRLLDQADAATRIAIARRLAPYPAVPALITRRLTTDVTTGATPAGPTSTASETPRVENLSASVPLVELSELFFSARSAERRLILLNLGYAAGATPSAFAGDVQEAARELETTALAREPRAFMRAIERWLDVTPALARRIVNDPFGEPIIVATKAIGLAPDAVQRILLFINPVIGRSISRVYELATLFELIEAQAAHALIGIWRAADPPQVKRSIKAHKSTDAADYPHRRNADSMTVEARNKAGPTSSSARAATARYRGTGSSGP
jgi:hypothetical protein